MPFPPYIGCLKRSIMVDFQYYFALQKCHILALSAKPFSKQYYNNRDVSFPNFYRNPDFFKTENKQTSVCINVPVCVCVWAYCTFIWPMCLLAVLIETSFQICF